MHSPCHEMTDISVMPRWMFLVCIAPWDGEQMHMAFRQEDSRQSVLGALPCPFSPSTLTLGPTSASPVDWPSYATPVNRRNCTTPEGVQ